MNKLKKISLLFTIVVGIILFAAYFSMGERNEQVLYEASILYAQAETYAQNIVTGIYLDYRIFDTVFEALLLLVSVIGVSQFSNLSDKEQKYFAQIVSSTGSTPPSQLVISSLKSVYPIMLIFGTYVIVTGSDGPGGGFQGGAIIAAIIMTNYIYTSNTRINLKTLEKIEKIMYVSILSCVTLFLFFSDYFGKTEHRLYLLMMNVLIGTKVFSGFVIIFLYFMGNKHIEK